MGKFKIIVLSILIFSSMNVKAIDFGFLIPNCINPSKWATIAEEMETIEEKFDITTEICGGTPEAFAGCSALVFPIAILTCQVAVISACSGAAGDFGESIGVLIADTKEILWSCAGLLPIAAYAVSLVESGNVDEALPCFLNLFAAATSVIGQLAHLDITKVVNEFKIFNQDISSGIQDVINGLVDALKAINTSFTELVNKAKQDAALYILVGLYAPIVAIFDGLLSFVDLFVQIAEMAPLLIMANACNNYAKGIGGLFCVPLIQLTCSKDGKQGHTPSSTSGAISKATSAAKQAAATQKQIANQTKNEKAKGQQAKQQLAAIKKQCENTIAAYNALTPKQKSKITKDQITKINSCEKLINAKTPKGAQQ